MPVLSYEGPKMTKEQKEKLIKELTEAAARVIPDIPCDAYYVFIREHDAECIGIGTKPLLDYLKSTRGRH